MQLQSGTLWQGLIETTEAALACSALHSIETASTELQQDGLPFVVRVATNLQRKAQDKQQRAADRLDIRDEFNPFLPPEPALTVGAVSATHLAVLNKFNVVERHLLVVTREFEHQESLLNLADFEALWRCLREYPSLGFYNGGEAAGASQKHKHLQLVPLPIYPQLGDFPFSALFTGQSKAAAMQHISALPFRHVWCRLPNGLEDDPHRAAQESLQRYRQMLQQAAIQALPGNVGERQSAPYNLLMTRQWMLLVPRSREFSQGISVNALGYVGSLFVKDRAGLERIRQTGPLTLLREVSLDYDASQ